MADSSVGNAVSHGDSPAIVCRAAIYKLSILLIVCCCFFRSEIYYIFSNSLTSADRAHVLAMPLVVLGLIVCRWNCLSKNVSSGSAWGLVLIIAGVVAYALLSCWPLHYGYLGLVAMIPILGGVVLVTCGWQVFIRCLPILLVIWLALPISSRHTARLIILPETFTLSVTQRILNALPDVIAYREGVDITYYHGSESGVIALGEPNRGANLLFACATLGTFAVFSRIRPYWQLAILGCLAVPILLACNILRMIVWGAVSVFLNANPSDGLPRFIAVFAGMFSCYFAFALLSAVSSRPVIDDTDAETSVKIVGEHRTENCDG